MIEGAKSITPASFFLVTSTNVRLSPNNFVTFSFNHFVTLVYNFKVIPIASPKFLNLNQDLPSKKVVFLVKSSENSGYNNFSHRNSRVTNFWLHDHIYNTI